MQSKSQALDAIELDSKSGEFQLGENGYYQFIPSDDEKVKIEAWLSEEISRAIEDHEPLFAEARETIEAYKAVKQRVEGSGESILPSPIVRIPADQIISSTVNEILRSPRRFRSSSR
jgi:hypothetical protein